MLVVPHGSSRVRPRLRYRRGTRATSSGLWSGLWPLLPTAEAPDPERRTAAPHLGAPHVGAPRLGICHCGAPHLGAFLIGRLLTERAPHSGLQIEGAPHRRGSFGGSFLLVFGRSTDSTWTDWIQGRALRRNLHLLEAAWGKGGRGRLRAMPRRKGKRSATAYYWGLHGGASIRPWAPDRSAASDWGASWIQPRSP